MYTGRGKWDAGERLLRGLWMWAGPGSEGMVAFIIPSIQIEIYNFTKVISIDSHRNLAARGHEY